MQFSYFNSNERILKITDNIRVPVIASFDQDGNCAPLYFRYTNPDHSTISVKIDRIEYSKPNSCFGTIFCCQVTLFDHQGIVYLFYHDDERMWYLRNHE